MVARVEVAETGFNFKSNEVASGETFVKLTIQSSNFS